MNKFLSKKLSIISFVFIPIVFLWNPHWIGFLGIQPYWPLFWLLPWSMIHGPISGLISGLFLGLTLDSITLENSFTQIPGLILCGLWFGKIKVDNDSLVGHFRYGLICFFGSFLCGTLFFLQILSKNFQVSNFLFLIPSVKNIFAEVFLTGFFAPLFCSKLFSFFDFYKGKAKNINLVNR